MIMSIFGFENKIIFTEDEINILEIYDKKLFTNFINCINEQCNHIADEDNKIVLMQDDERLKIDRYVYLLTDVFNIDFNSKKIVNKIYTILSQNLKNRQDDELENITLKLRNYLIEEINELPFEFNIESEIEINDLLKCFNVVIDTSCYTSIVEKIEYIINILSTLNIADILIIPNLKTFLSEEELLEIYKYAIYNNVRLLLIENSHSEKILKYENKNIIDENFDEF